tara:strand:- start:952 stop:1809 length:858 start_codon:yes stop_codon:yes gene_type:complete
MIFKIRFFSSFGDATKIGPTLERLCETEYMSNYGKNIQITNGDDYTHVFILNTAMPKLKEGFPKSNVVGLAFEPIYFLGLTPEFVKYAEENIGRYFIGDKKNLPDVFVEHFGYMWYCTPCRSIPEKTKPMSIMISEKGKTFGHLYRHELVKEILKTDLPIDIYGRGCGFYKFYDPRIKGQFEELEPYTDYEFHICIENIETHSYFSEKIMNPLLNGTTPIYLGCKTIESYFGNIITLSKNVENDMNLIKNIIKNPSEYKKDINLEKVKDKIYLYRNLDKIFDVDE